MADSSISYYSRNKEKFRTYYLENREKKIQYQRLYNTKKTLEKFKTENKVLKKKNEQNCLKIEYGTYILTFDF